MFVPLWLSKLPVILGRPRLAIDNNVISDFYLRKNKNPELSYIFDASNIVCCISRQVINEALNAPELPPMIRKQVWGELGTLQLKGKLFLSGITQMTPPEQTVYFELANLLGRSNLSAGKDANVYADAIVKHLPLYTTEVRSIDGMRRALGNRGVMSFLTSHKLPADLKAIVANCD